ncbi:EF-P lysine aminoacylase EpmA [Stieleria sp. TO1_6]|uniref:EF-P lysine aminoacylase EpmA n=1 Tax=Stieleria tagensis TaxID=2956795 RepID=UPI00209B77A6|nr:EF-P lysine aminoacylase EpmA [Stieleria tagensis]MCO8121560.1 EF-P lysine aminoacylase EpmA [Stieleria tagensis]
MANLNHLVERADLLRLMRRYFDERGFIEVQPPCLSQDCVVDAYLDPIRVATSELGIADPGFPPQFYLQTSPESAMKRMLVDGAPSIYSIGPVFRKGEAGHWHNPEFTMLEWYEVGGDVDSAIELLGNLVSQALCTDGFDRVSYRQAFRRSVGFDPIDVTTSALHAHVQRLDTSIAETIGSDHDALLDVVLSAEVAPTLGLNRAEIMTDYPLGQAALAKRSATDPQCAARFELFVRGVEIANGYDELLDAEELLERSVCNNQKRVQVGLEALEPETSLVRAMRRGLPACSGVALGVDRLLMQQQSAPQIGDVIAFPIHDA